jgi:diacylglycerol kinase
MKNRLHKSIGYALNGIAHGISTERNIRYQMAIAFFIVIISLLLKIPKIELLLIIFVSFLVIILEMINTSIERLIDKIHPKKDEELGHVKDLIGGAVLLSVLLSIIIGIIILLEPIMKLFQK